MSNNTNNIPKFNTLFKPLLIEQFFQMLLGNVDIFLLSKVEDSAVASVGMAKQLLTISTMVLGIVTLGSTILFLHYSSNPDKEKMQSIIRQSIFLNLTLSILLFLNIFIFGNSLLLLIKTPLEILDTSKIYLYIVGFGLIFQSIMSISSSVLRSFAYVNIAMKISVIINLTNIIGNAVVIFFPGVFFQNSIVGISVVTLSSYMLGAVLSIYLLKENLPTYFSGLFRFKFDFKIIKEILKLGIPSAMESISHIISQTIITSIIATMGTLVITSKIYAQTITSFVFIIGAASGQAGQIIIGRLISSKKFEEARKFGNANTNRFVLVALICNLLVAAFSPFLIRLFTQDPLIIKTTQILLFLNCLYDPLRVANETEITALLVAKDVKFPVIVGAIVIYLFTVPASYITVELLNHSIVSVWIIFIIDEFIRAGIFKVRWNKMKWSKYNGLQ